MSRSIRCAGADQIDSFYITCTRTWSSSQINPIITLEKTWSEMKIIFTVMSELCRRNWTENGMDYVQGRKTVSIDITRT